MRTAILMPVVLIAWLLAGTVLGRPGFGAEPTGTATRGDWDFEAAERELELWRHERLAARRVKPGTELAPFTTDGCSGGLSAAWAYLAQAAPDLAEIYGDAPPWEACCVEHDRRYHGAAAAGATYLESFDARKDADRALRACVVETGAVARGNGDGQQGLSEAQSEFIYDTVATVMYRAVRLGGVPCSGLPWRWGYGWPDCG